jgi:hypothetical protein
MLGFQPEKQTKAQIEAEKAKLDALFDPDLQRRRLRQVAEESKAMRPVPTPVGAAAPRRRRTVTKQLD